MDGEELKLLIKQSGMSISELADKLGTSPQNLNARFKRKSIKLDFLKKVKDILDQCCPPLPAEMENAVYGANINSSYSNVNQTIGNNAALVAENNLLKQQNQFLQQQVERLTSLLENK